MDGLGSHGRDSIRQQAAQVSYRGAPPFQKIANAVFAREQQPTFIRCDTAQRIPLISAKILGVEIAE